MLAQAAAAPRTAHLPEITTLQSLGVFLVVLGHAYVPGVTYPPLLAWVHRFLYSFHMPLFMALAGFLFAYRGGIKGGYGAFLGKKARRLLVPYLFWNSLAYFPKMMLAHYALRPPAWGLQAYFLSLIYPWTGVIQMYWFLPTLFLVFCLAPLFHFCLSRGRLTRFLATAALLAVHLAGMGMDIALFNMGGALSYAIFFWCGCLLAFFWQDHAGILGQPALVLLAVLLVVLNLWAWQELAIKLVVACLGILTAFAFSRIYVQRGWRCLDFLNGHYYQIYLLSWFPQIFCVVVLFKVLGLPLLAVSLCMLASGLLVPLWIDKAALRFKVRGKVLLGR